MPGMLFFNAKPKFRPRGGIYLLLAFYLLPATFKTVSSFFQRAFGLTVCPGCRSWEPLYSPWVSEQSSAFPWELMPEMHPLLGAHSARLICVRYRALGSLGQLIWWLFFSKLLPDNVLIVLAEWFTSKSGKLKSSITKP